MELVQINEKKLVNKTATETQLFEVAKNYKGLILSNDKALKPSTLKSYITTGKYFVQFIKERGLNFHTLKMYRMFLENTPLAVSTKNTYLTASKNICNNAYSNELINFQVFDVKLFEQSKEHTKDGLTTNEVKRLLTYIETIKKESRKQKARLLTYLLAFQGLRSSEVVNIKVSNIDFENQTILIKGKGRDDYENISILHTSTIDLLNDWIKLNGFSNDAYIFSSIRNHYKPVSTAYLRELFTGNVKTVKGQKKVVKGLFDRVDIKNSVHGFRHFFVTWLLEQGYSLSEVQKFSRHKTFETIKVYDDRRLKKKLTNQIKLGLSSEF